MGSEHSRIQGASLAKTDPVSRVIEIKLRAWHKLRESVAEIMNQTKSGLAEIR